MKGSMDCGEIIVNYREIIGDRGIVAVGDIIG